MKSWLQGFTLDFLYKNWAKMGLLLAIYLVIMLLSFQQSISDLVFYAWLTLPLYFAHQFEEHCLPGKFKEFFNHHLFHKTFIPLNEKNVFWINVVLTWVLFPIAAILAQHVGISFGLFLAYFLLLNASIHIISFLVKRKYNPGLVTSVLLFVPAGLYFLHLFHTSHLLHWTNSLIAIGIALILHIAIVIYAFYIYKKKKYTRL